MAYISNQWLNKGGRGIRNREYAPVAVTISASAATGPWSERRDIAVDISATRENSEHQALHLTTAETERLAQFFVERCPDRFRQRLALQIIKDMSDTMLVETITIALKRRLQRSSVRTRK